MTDRDRLAADLSDVVLPDGLRPFAADYADRLIALGWTDGKSTANDDQVSHALDEERLARALHAVPTFCLAARQVMGRETSHADTDARLAAAIAKEYQEDTDAHD